MTQPLAPMGNNRIGMKSYYRHGFADAVMGRGSCCPDKGFLAQRYYIKGYMAGKATGVRFNHA